MYRLMKRNNISWHSRCLICLLLFVSCVEVTSGKDWLINSTDILSRWLGQDRRSSLDSWSCNFLLTTLRPDYHSQEPSLNQSSQICNFQPDYNFLCNTKITNQVLKPGLGCSKSYPNSQAPYYTWSPAPTLGKNYFSITASKPNGPTSKPNDPTSLKPNDQSSWQCIISEEKMCNGLSMCLTDECQCADIDVFYCADGVGCIAHANVCDGMEDCRDGSDECMCDDVIQCTVQDHTYCVPRVEYCNDRDTIYYNCALRQDVNCSDQMVTAKGKKENPMTQCTDYYFANKSKAGSVWPSFINFEPFCLQNCDSAWSHFCNKIWCQLHFGCFLVKCKKESDKTDINKKETLLNLCDGVIDCSGGMDEMNCPGRYYCNSSESNEWIALDKLCDNKKDCSNGKDECDNCTGRRTAGVASDQFMVQSRGMRNYMIVVSVLTVTMNVFAGSEIYRRDVDTRAGRVDKVFLITLCAYDALMGLCVGFTFIKATIFSGNYCLKDNEWRASLQCKLLGCCFTLAAHGSLLTVSMMSLTRCYKLVFNRTIRVKVIVVITAIAFIFNTLHSALPIIPLSGVQDIFRASMTFSDNPFVTDYNSQEMKRKYRFYKGEDVFIFIF